jgi:hypothetical protein
MLYILNLRSRNFITGYDIMLFSADFHNLQDVGLAVTSTNTEFLKFLDIISPANSELRLFHFIIPVQIPFIGDSLIRKEHISAVGHSQFSD